MSSARLSKMLQGSQVFRQEWANEKARIGYTGLTRAQQKLAYAQFRAARNAKKGKSNSARLTATLSSSRVGSGVYQQKRYKATKKYPKGSVYAIRPKTLANRLSSFGNVNSLRVAQLEQADPTRRGIRAIYDNPAYEQYYPEMIAKQRKARAIRKHPLYTSSKRAVSGIMRRKIPMAEKEALIRTLLQSKAAESSVASGGLRRRARRVRRARGIVAGGEFY